MLWEQCSLFWRFHWQAIAIEEKLYLRSWSLVKTLNFKVEQNLLASRSHPPRCLSSRCLSWPFIKLQNQTSQSNLRSNFDGSFRHAGIFHYFVGNSIFKFDFKSLSTPGTVRSCLIRLVIRLMLSSHCWWPPSVRRVSKCHPVLTIARVIKKKRMESYFRVFTCANDFFSLFNQKRSFSESRSLNDRIWLIESFASGQNLAFCSPNER